MIERYTRPAMARLWSTEHRLQRWLEVELLASEAWARLGVVPADVPARMRQNARIDPDRMLEIEQTVQHDVIAFTTQVGETLGADARWLHYGLTSSDVVDTALSSLTAEALDLVLMGVDDLLKALRKKAIEHRHTVMIGRTHGVHAEPTTFGLKMALFHQEFLRQRDRLARARRAIAVGKISGAVGTFAQVDPAVETYVCQKLGLEPAPISTQILQRDRHAEVVLAVAQLAASLEKLALEIRNLARTEVREVEEPFLPGQKGSSSMPHKRNPRLAEQICGLARVCRANALAALEDVALWHERDISHSSVERVIIPDSTTLADYMLATMTFIVDRLVVFPERMRQNLEMTGGLIFSQRVLLGLVEAGLSREDAYRIVQTHAMAAWQGGPSFRERIQTDPEVVGRISPDRLEGLFDPVAQLGRVDEIFARLGL